jgi:PKD repeat protein
MAFFANGTLTKLGLVNPIFSGKQVVVTDPELIGPDRLCNVFGSVIGSFFGAGDPLTDVYSWKISGPANQLLFNGTGGAGFQTISYTFSEIGKHRLELTVKRGIDIIYESEKIVDVIKGPIILLKPEYSVCQNQAVTLKVLDPASANYSEYTFEWKNETGTIVGNQNEYTTTNPGNYNVKFSFSDSNGSQVCETTLSTEIKEKTDFQVIASATQTCPDQTVNYSTSPLTSGSWYFKKGTNPTLKLLGSGNAITVRPNIDLPGIGDYEIIFETVDPENPTCNQQKITKLSFLPQPDFLIVGSIPASGCNTNDGKLTVKALTPLNYISIDGFGVSSPSLVAGEVFEFQNLESGAYTLISVLGPCFNAYGTVIPLANPPLELEFEIKDLEGEYCTAIGKENGSFTINMLNGKIDGSYRIINIKGTIVQELTFLDQEIFQISIPGGRYFFEIFDNKGCNLPESQEIIVPSLSQVEFSVPAELSICQSFDLTPSTNGNLLFTLTTPSGIVEAKMAGDPFKLTEEGEYSLVGINPSKPELCPNQRKFKVVLVEPVNFEPKLIKEDCFGNRTFEADIFGRDPKTVKFNWKNEKNEVVGTGQFLDLAPSSFGNYTLDVQPSNSAACPIPPKQILIEEPVLTVELELTNSKLCELGPGSVISLTIDKPASVTDITWRKFTVDILGAEIIENLPQFDNQLEPVITEPGVYEATVFSIIPSIGKSCELGRNSIEILVTPEKVDFEIPTNLSICETYELTPITSQVLVFEITYPNGETTTRQSGEPLILNQNGVYTFFGFNPDFGGLLCPQIKTLDVKLNTKIPFTPELIQETCDGTKIYQANLGAINPATADFTWFDESGNIIGTSEFLTLKYYGNFALDVQPKGSIPCDQIPVPFFVETPLLEVPVSIFSDPLCPDAAFTVITATSQFELVNRIEWWFTDLNGVEKQLASETDRKEILALEEGTYEVRILNSLYCLLGFDKILVMRSMDAVRPEVKENYLVCPRYEIAETINPGQFASYEWYHEGILVSTNSTYKPLLIGNFELIVFSAEGCAYQATFVTEEECELKVSFPNAIQPGNPDKQFLIYTNYLIDELEVFIFSKWGEVIFQCANSELISEASTCPWDGTFAGKGIPPGSYAIRINYKNLEKNISKYYIGSVLVIE